MHQLDDRTYLSATESKFRAKIGGLELRFGFGIVALWDCGSRVADCRRLGGVEDSRTRADGRWLGDSVQRWPVLISSDLLHPPLHRDDHLRSRSEPGVGDDDISVLSALTPCWQAVQPGTVF
ncbi:hypothetical protein E3N88_41539 [Mikania micrantha]|uniref:Uncharacterized protein n=1 Tax=Mikania micrantha TaxID=192012 RepID=A0A5N6LKC5_9ASTR|nr:hypothetical protein E3N88_41539 [Mikania micrantha]